MPVWACEVPEVHDVAPLLRGDCETDVAIIGGGLTGVSAAMHLAERNPELGILLLESRSLGASASGRNAGQLLHGFASDPIQSSEERLRAYEATELGIQIAETWAARHAPPGTLRRDGCLALYTSNARAEAAAREVEADAAMGVPGRFVASSELRLRGACGGVLDPRAGILNAYALLRALYPVLAERGVRIHEQTRVCRMEHGRTHLLETPGGRVRARAIVIATNAETPGLGLYRDRLLSLRAHVLATPPLADALWRELDWSSFGGFSDDLTRIAYASRTSGGRLVFGGGSNAAYSYGHPARSHRAEPTERTHRELRRVLLQYLPELADTPTANLWSGSLCIPVDRICSIGVGGEGGSVYHALGYSGHGLSLALLAGRVIADLHAGHHDPWRDLPFYQRAFRRWPPEPLRWLGYEAVTRMMGRIPFLRP